MKRTEWLTNYRYDLWIWTLYIFAHQGEQFVRGITSLAYREYGVDFSSVIAMLMLHKHMKSHVGNNYAIIYAALNESKLELIITSDQAKKQVILEWSAQQFL